MLYLIFFIIISILFIIIPFNKISIKTIKLRAYIFPVIMTFLLVLLIIFSKDSFESAKKGFMLWVNNVIPSLLPFFICIEIINQTNLPNLLSKTLEPIMKPLFNVPGCGAMALAMGISSGYPVGAKVANDLYNKKLCTKVQAERLLAFTNTSGPLFIIGAIGIGMLESAKIGSFLLLTHFLSSISVGLLFRKYKVNLTNIDNIISQNSDTANTKIMSNTLGNIFGKAIKNSINTILMIGGYIVFFSVISEILIKTNFLSLLSLPFNSVLNIFGFSKELSVPILTGILEITNGIKNLSGITTIPYMHLLPVIAFVLGFGGFSVHMQVSSIIAESKLSMKPYLFGKLLQGIFASIYTYLLMKYTSIGNIDLTEVFSYNSKAPIYSSFNLFLIVIITMIIIAVYVNLFKIGKRD